MKKTAIVIGAWFNANAPKNKVTLILNQENDLPTAGGNDATSKMLIASSVRSAVKPLRTIWPVSETVAQGVGINVATLSTDAKNPSIFEEPIEGKDVFGFDVSIVVNETVTKDLNNPRSAKVNPSTGQECLNGGNPIYRYEQLLPTEDAPTTKDGKLAHTVLSIDK